MSDLFCLQPLQLNSLYQRDLVALWASEPIAAGTSGRAFVLLRALSPIERLAWGIDDSPNLALGLIAEESESGGNLVRALLRRPNAGPLPTSPPDILDVMEASQRLAVPAASLALSWGAFHEKGGAA
jgi:hypothetical protein